MIIPLYVIKIEIKRKDGVNVILFAHTWHTLIQNEDKKKYTQSSTKTDNNMTKIYKKETRKINWKHKIENKSDVTMKHI